MPDPSRSRSDSMEASSSQQDRKRPRLENCDIDQVESTESLTDTGRPMTSMSSPSADPNRPHMENGSRVSISERHESAEMTTSPSNLSSKVTIQTRAAPPLSTAQGSRPSSQDSKQNVNPDDVPSTAQPAVEPDLQSDMVGAPTDTISISSSPSKSPEIEAAELEDFDETAGQTVWMPVTQITNNNVPSPSRQKLPRHHVCGTFPFAERHSTCGQVHTLIPLISQIFQAGTKHLLQLYEHRH